MAELADLAEVGTGEIHSPLPQRVTAELIGSALLSIAVVGSGVMASRLSSDVGLQLLENAAATAAALIALILTFGSVSGAHFNPCVTIIDRMFGNMPTADAALYVLAQIAGCCLGALAANAMFDLPTFQFSVHARSSGGLWMSEVIATAGLLLVIHGCARAGHAMLLPFAVASWIAGAYWFTSSTSFANPAITIGRTLSDTFAGIQPASAPMFLAMQLVGTAAAYVLIRFFFPIAQDPRE